MFSAKQLYLIGLFCIIGGVIFYAFYDEKIHIDYSVRNQTVLDWNKAKKSLIYVYIKNDSPITLTETSYISDFDQNNLKNVINKWLSHASEYHPTLQKIICQSLEIKNGIYYCSFSQSPFLSTTSMYEKYSFFEGLLQTLFNLETFPKGIIFLINHQLFEDEDYDFTLPWSTLFYK